MLEMSAAKSPALALSGAASAVVPGATNADGAQIVDFSMVLAGATLAGEAPALVSDMLIAPEADAPAAPDLVPQPATLPGKSASSGNSTGKNVPAGKLPAARPAAVTDKAPRKLRKEDVELSNEGTDAAPEQDAVVAPEPGEQVSVQTASSVPASIDPTAAATAPAPEAASNVILVASAQHAAAAQPTQNDTIAESEPTLTKLQSRAPAQTQTNVVAANATDDAVKPAAATPTAEESAHSARGPVLSNQPLPLHGAARTKPSVEEGALPVPNAPWNAGSVAATRIEVGANQPTTVSAVSAAQVTVAHAPIAQPTIAPLATAPELSTPATSTHLQTTTAVIPPTIVVAPAVARSAAGALLAQAAPSLPAALPITEPVTEAAAISTLATASALTTASRLVEFVAESPAPLALTTDPAVAAVEPDGEPIADVGVAPRKAAISAVTLPVAALLTDSPPTSTSTEIGAQIKPVGTAQTTSGAEVLARQAPEPSTMASRMQLAQALAPAYAALPATPASTPATESATIVSQAPVVQDHSGANAATAQPNRVEAAMVSPVLAASDKDQKVAVTISPATSVEVPTTFARLQMDASTLAAEFRNAPSAPTVTTSSAAATPTQDIAALVDRITEARAAASPHTIRASLVHEDFGAVSVNLRAEASQIHVTLGNADPGFAPAVQAAAAANLAGNSGDDAQNRREASAPQSGTQPQEGARNDSSSQQQAQRERTNAGERQPSRQTLRGQLGNSGERASTTTVTERRSGIYA